MVTVTMGLPKIGLYFHPGRGFAGRLVIQDLGYPDDLIETKKIALFYPTDDDLSGFLPARKPAGNKFDHGLALILAGSRGLTGSAAMAAAAAMRTGCGMTHLFVPESILPILAAKLTATVLHPIPETAEGTAALSARSIIREKSLSMQGFCIGPGMSHAEETGALIRTLVSDVNIPVILDADGINAYKDRSDELASHAGDLIITPHSGEWRRLFGDLPATPVKIVEQIWRKRRPSVW